MNTKNNRNEKIISGLLPMIALLTAVLGCGGSNTSQPVANQTAVAPANTTAANAAAPVNASTANSASNSTAENPAAVFYGKWEKKEPGQAFRFETFGPASKQGDNYVGKVTDQANVVVANYTVFGNKTIEIAYLPQFYGGTSFTYPYEFSDNGKKLTLDANPPIVYTKGASNTNIEKDVTFFTSGGAWKSAKDPLRELAFFNGQQEDKGWSGEYEFTYNGTMEEDGTFEIIEGGKMTLKPSSRGSKAYTYKVRGELFDFTRDRDGDTDTYGH